MNQRAARVQKVKEDAALNLASSMLARSSSQACPVRNSSAADDFVPAPPNKMPAFVRTPATSQPSALSRASPVMKSPNAALPDITSLPSAKLPAASAKVPLPETPINRITGVTLNSSFGFQCTSNLWCCTSRCCHQDSRCPSRIEASYSEAHRHSCTCVWCCPSLAFSHFALSSEHLTCLEARSLSMARKQLPPKFISVIYSVFGMVALILFYFGIIWENTTTVLIARNGVSAFSSPSCSPVERMFN